MVSPLVAGLVGLWVGGPIGALIGAGGAILWNKIAAGVAEADASGRPSEHSSTGGGGASSSREQPSDSTNYLLSFMVLVAAVMKADGHASRDELEVVKRFLSDNYPADVAREALTSLRDLLKKDIPVESVCAQMARHFNVAARRQLFHTLCAIAYADEVFTEDELRVLLKIGEHLRLSRGDIVSITAMFSRQAWERRSSSNGSRYRSQSRSRSEPSLDDDYKILGVSASATDQEVKKAYRQMAIKHHPDKVAHLGQAAQQQATKKFQTIQSAYDRICVARKMK